jgi:putative membrane protein
MIIGCLPMVYKRAKHDKVKVIDVAVFVLALSFMLVLAIVSGDLLENKTLAQLGGLKPGLLVWIFFASFVSAATMIVPGISGSVILLMFGAYTVFVESISTLNFAIIAVIGTGMILGALTGVKLVKIVLKHFPHELYCAVLGFIIGSIFIIYPGFTFDVEGFAAIVLGLMFIALTYFISKKSSV